LLCEDLFKQFLVIVEQDIVQALKAANHVYCPQEGRIALTGAAATLTREAISALTSEREGCERQGYAPTITGAAMSSETTAVMCRQH
jgi:hypothetical protein